MSSATASAVDVPRTDNAIHGQNHSGQCTPMPLPALGSQRIVQGNGTSVGTVISLLCPPRHRLVGGVVCVWGSNSTRWFGDTPWCEPPPQNENFGFHVAVVASIVSAAIILLMSMAFLTCCLHDCVKKEERKKEEREMGLWPQMEGNRSSYYNHKGRNNNNNTQEKALTLWDNYDPNLCDHRRHCRCYEQYPYAVTGSASTFGPPLSSAAFPCRVYKQPLLPQNSGLYQHPASSQTAAPPQYPGPPRTSGLGQSSALSSISGPVWHHGGQEMGASVMTRPPLEDSRRMSGQLLSAQDCSIRVISV
ncbi:uncharacterized protein LOC134018867 [Osmerus eperlanus]|uniref:uncharacterized protein LOC134018867 n=1 Tax=Osmerus eperlanus TaxID=29151 RepID=UPI002E146F84